MFRTRRQQPAGAHLAGPEEQEQGERDSCQPAPRCRRLLLTGTILVCRETARRRFLLNYPHVWVDYFTRNFLGKGASWNSRGAAGAARPECAAPAAPRVCPTLRQGRPFAPSLPSFPPPASIPASLPPSLPSQTHSKGVREPPLPGSALSAPKCARQHLDASI